MSRLELKRSIRYNVNRLEYMLTLNMVLKGKRFEFDAKFDTGAVATILSLDVAPFNKRCKEIIKDAEFLPKRFSSASSDGFDVYRVHVDWLSLTEEVQISNPYVYFSYDLKNKHLLGADIITIFNHVYEIDKRSKSGTYWLINWENDLNNFEEWSKDKEFINLSAYDVDALYKDIPKSLKVGANRNQILADFIRNNKELCQYYLIKKGD